ncbi:MAG TPA: hypothetical protein VFA52_02865 [Candidatus Paceibacterota bacterium]|nr:hypothetical protein [Candidatus Paceibacterota bacterium]
MFDKTAFKFITIFLIILLFSFTLFIVIGRYQPVSPESQLCCTVESNQ